MTALQLLQTESPPEEMIKKICQEANITRWDLISNRRPKRLVLWRQAGYYVIREKWGLSYPKIGQLMGGKHHTTVMHGVAQFAKYCREYAHE